VSDPELGKAVPVSRSVIQQNPVLILRLVLRDYEKASQVINPSGTGRANETGELRTDQSGRWRRELLNTAKLSSRTGRIRIAEVEVVDGKLLMETATGVRPLREDPKGDLVVMPHEIATHYVAARVEPVKARGQQQVGGRECSCGEDYDVAPKRLSGTRFPIHTVNRRDAATLCGEPSDDCIGPELEPPPEQRPYQRGRQVVLGTDGTGKAVASTAANAGSTVGCGGIVDGQRQAERPASELLRRLTQLPGYRGQLGCRVGKGYASWGLGRVDP
jgi:hypothetical protein